MTIKAIETRYAGCHFRSRLEARWAVFFDHLGAPWQYEPQGYELPWRLSLNYEETLSYLPDFWLPTPLVWAEVKGILDEAEALRLLNAAAALSSGGGDGCGYDNDGRDLVVLGPIPTAQDLAMPYRWSPTRLHMHKGNLLASPWIYAGPHDGESIAGDYGGNRLKDILDGNDPIKVINQLLRPCWYEYGQGANPPGILAALTAARSARFEHGQAGA